MSRIVSAIVLLSGAAALLVFFVLPQWRNFQALGEEIGDLDEVGREFDDLIARREQILGVIGSISKENIDRLDRMLPRGPHTSDFLVSLEALAASSGVSLRRVDLVSPQGAKSGTAAGRPVSAAQPRPVSSSGTPGEIANSAGGEEAAGSGEDAEMRILPFAMQVAGSYGNFKRLLAGFEKNIRLIDVDEISFNSAGVKDQPLEFTVKATTYYQ